MEAVEAELNASTTTTATKNEPHYLSRGFYFDQLSTYLAHFSPCQIHVAVSERLLKQPRQQTHMVFKFLGVDALSSSSSSATANATHHPQYTSGVFNRRGRKVVLPPEMEQALALAANATADVQQDLDGGGGGGSGSDDEQENLSARLQEWEWNSPPVTKLRARLAKDVFAPQNAKLIALLGVSGIPEWDHDQ